MPRQHAEKVDDEKDRLPGKEKVVVEQIHRHPEREVTFFAIDDRIIQRRQHVWKQRHNVQKVVEEDVVHRKAGEGIQAAGQHAPILVPHPAARPKVAAAPGQGDFQAEQRHHHPRHEPRGHQQRQPEKRAAQQVERVGIDKPAAQIGSPTEAAPLLDEAVGVLVKVDLLVIEIARVMEVPAACDGIHQAVGRKQGGRCQQAEPEHLPVSCFFAGKLQFHNKPR